MSDYSYVTDFFKFSISNNIYQSLGKSICVRDCTSENLVYKS